MAEEHGSRPEAMSSWSCRHSKYLRAQPLLDNIAFAIAVESLLTAAPDYKVQGQHYTALSKQVGFFFFYLDF